MGSNGPVDTNISNIKQIDEENLKDKNHDQHKLNSEHGSVCDLITWCQATIADRNQALEYFLRQWSEVKQQRSAVKIIITIISVIKILKGDS